MQVGVIGGGIVGLASARALLLKRPGLRVTVFEKERDVSLHQSSRSSNVLHSGIYYAPGSERAALCVAGAEMAREYCRDHPDVIPAKLDAGKLIVAADETEVARLHNLFERGTANGVRGLEMLSATQLAARGVAGVAAIWSPTTGLVTGALSRASSREMW
jgi:L-2-hydroxyglutarate oxidase LhgO